MFCFYFLFFGWTGDGAFDVADTSGIRYSVGTSTITPGINAFRN